MFKEMGDMRKADMSRGTIRIDRTRRVIGRQILQDLQSLKRALIFILNEMKRHQRVLNNRRQSNLHSVVSFWLLC